MSHVDEQKQEFLPRGAPRYNRRLSDKVLVAFHQACDQGDFEVASLLLDVLDTLVSRDTAGTPDDRRRRRGSLVAACERLWHLRNGHAAV